MLEKMLEGFYSKTTNTVNPFALSVFIFINSKDDEEKEKPHFELKIVRRRPEKCLK